jgi:hypothetical protein
LPELTTDNKCPNPLFYVWLPVYILFVINTGWIRDSLQMLLYVNVCSTIKAFWDVNNKKWRIWCKFVSPLSLKTFIAYLSSQTTPNFQIKYFMFDWSIYRLFVLNRGWKRDSLQIMIFVYIWSTWGIVDLKKGVLRRE